MSDDAWAPPESDFVSSSAGSSPDDTSWSPPESDFQPTQNQAPAKETASQPNNALGDTLGYYGRALAKAAINTVTGLPLMAADAGVAARNTFGKYTGIGGTDYELPSSMYRNQLNETFGAPQNTMEKINDVVLPMIMGAGAASSEAPAALRQLMGVPEAAAQAPSNFVSPADTQKQMLAQTIQKGQDLGLVVPPQTTNPGALNATVETIGGKIATQQGASILNQPIANAAAAADLSQTAAPLGIRLNPDAPLTEPGLRQLISEAGQGYDAVRHVGKVTVEQPYLQTLADVADKFGGPAGSFPGSKPSPILADVDSLLQPSFDASHAVDKIAELRDAASAAYRAGESRLGSGYRQLSGALEDQLDRSISRNPDVSANTVANFRASRVLAAKAHSVLDALNPATGDISIQALAKSDAPLTGNLKTLADFGAAAPRATQDAAKIGSHGVSHLDTVASMLTGALGEHVAGPWGMAAGAAYPAARWGARAYALGPGQAGALPEIASGAAGSPAAAEALLQGTQGINTEIQRAAGGKVGPSEDELLDRLMSRWRSAKKATDASTKPLLKLPDATVAAALKASSRGI